MIRSFARPAAALAAVLALSAAACADASDETAESRASQAGDAANAAQDSEPAAPAAAPASAQTDLAAEAAANAPDEAWRTVDPEDLLVIDTEHGLVWVELAPEFAPAHVERMKTLARRDYFDYTVWHRVIDDFMAQGGIRLDDPAYAPEGLGPMEAEFTTRRGAELSISELQERVINARMSSQTAQAGFWNGFPAGTQPIAQASIRADGQVESWLLHCTGAAAMARTGDPNSARAQFYITRADADHLNADYTVWGRVRDGQEAIDALAVGTMGQTMGFRPDYIQDVQVAADLPEDEVPTIQVMDTDSAAFLAYLDALEARHGSLPDVCDIEVPVRIQE